MTNIVFFKKSDVFIGFRIKGHADYSEYGYDIVCSGISAISITLINLAKEVLKLDGKFNSNEKKANVEFIASSKNKEDKLDKFSVMLKASKLTFDSFQEAYPKNVSVSIKEK